MNDSSESTCVKRHTGSRASIGKELKALEAERRTLKYHLIRLERRIEKLNRQFHTGETE